MTHFIYKTNPLPSPRSSTDYIKKLQKAFVIFTTVVAALFISTIANATCPRHEAYHYVDVTNETGYKIYHLYISHIEDPDWGEDVLGRHEVIHDSQRKRIYICKDTSDTSPWFDIQAQDENGDTYTFWDVDVEWEDLIIYSEDMDEISGMHSRILN